MTGWADLLPASLVGPVRDALSDTLVIRHEAVCQAAGDPGGTIELFDRLVDEYVDARTALDHLEARRHAEAF